MMEASGFTSTAREMTASRSLPLYSPNLLASQTPFPLFLRSLISRKWAARLNTEC